MYGFTVKFSGPNQGICVVNWFTMLGELRNVVVFNIVVKSLPQFIRDNATQRNKKYKRNS